MMVSTRLLAVALGGSLLLLPACSEDDGGTVRSTGDESGSASGSESGSGSGSGSASGVATCSPVGEDLEAEATETVTMDLVDFGFEPSDFEVAAGIVTFETTNVGEEDHELAVLPGGGEVPFVSPGEPDEDALAAAGAFELEAFPAGESCNATWELEPGTYTLFCIVPSADGETHYEKGMKGTLVVS